MLLASTASAVETSKQHGELATDAPNAHVAMTTGKDASASKELASVTAVMAASVDDDGIVIGLRGHFALVVTGRYQKN